MADLKISALTASTTPLAGTEVLPIVQSSTTKKVSVANLTAGRSVGMLQANISAAAGAGFTTPAFIADDGTGSIRLLFLGSTYVGVPANKPWFHSYQDIYIGSDGGASVNFVNAGTNVSISNGNVVIGTSGKGIDFSATPGTGTSELLADYEEGNWTPAAGANLAIVGTPTFTGQYTKVGNTVTAWGSVSATTSVSYTAGGQILSGLPYTAQGTIAVGTIINNAFTVSSSIATLPTTAFLYGAEAIAATTAIHFQVTYHV